MAGLGVVVPPAKRVQRGQPDSVGAAAEETKAVRPPRPKKPAPSGVSSPGLAKPKTKVKTPKRKSLVTRWKDFKWVLKDRREVSLKESGLLDTPLVGLYFSASWCPPCRAFTPKLNKVWEKKKEQLSLFLVSRDTDTQRDYQRYLDCMEFGVALPFQSADAEGLAKEYKVTGIPTLVILDSRTGTLITKNGREDIGTYGEAAVERWRHAAHSKLHRPPAPKKED